MNRPQTYLSTRHNNSYLHAKEQNASQTYMQHLQTHADNPEDIFTKQSLSQVVSHTDIIGSPLKKGCSGHYLSQKQQKSRLWGIKADVCPRGHSQSASEATLIEIVGQIASDVGRTHTYTPEDICIDLGTILVVY